MLRARVFHNGKNILALEFNFCKLLIPQKALTKLPQPPSPKKQPQAHRPLPLLKTSTLFNPVYLIKF
jgi:hypothetical protein